MCVFGALAVVVLMAPCTICPCAFKHINTFCNLFTGVCVCTCVIVCVFKPVGHLQAPSFQFRRFREGAGHQSDVVESTHITFVHKHTKSSESRNDCLNCANNLMSNYVDFFHYIDA